MADRGWFWILVGITFFLLCPYTLVITTVVSQEMGVPAIYHQGNTLLGSSSLKRLSQLCHYYPVL
jgi:hypothetical protein